MKLLHTFQVPVGLALAGGLSLAVPPKHQSETGGMHQAGAMQVTGGEATVERRLGSMGTYLDLSVSAADRPRALRSSEAAVRAIEAAAQRLSTWTETSELAALNRAPVGTLLEDSALVQELECCLEVQAATLGAFDPAVGALVSAWDLRGSGRVPAVHEIAVALTPGGMAAIVAIEATPGGGRQLRKIGAGTLEEGAFGKGAALDRALAALVAAGATRAQLDLGGQVAVYSKDAQTDAFELLLADPRRRDEPVLAVKIPSGSLATTGNSERGMVIDGVPYAHVLDPRSGYPANDFGSLTVWTSQALLADALSTGLYVLGPEAALAWAESHPGVEVLVLECLSTDASNEDGQPARGRIRARATNGLLGRVRALDERVELQLPCTPFSPVRLEPSASRPASPPVVGDC